MRAFAVSFILLLYWDDDWDGEHLRATCINVSFLFLDESYTCVCLILVVES